MLSTKTRSRNEAHPDFEFVIARTGPASRRDPPGAGMLRCAFARILAYKLAYIFGLPLFATVGSASGATSAFEVLCLSPAFR